MQLIASDAGTNQRIELSGSATDAIRGDGSCGAVTASAAWGAVSGTLSAQTDLQNALNAKGTSNFSGAYADLTGKPTLGTMSAWTPTVSATTATTGTMTVAMGEGVRTITPTGACTFNATGGTAGMRCTFAITTSGTSSFVLTFGTNFRKTGTLATGTTSARFFAVSFVCVNGTIWQEMGRTAVQT